MLSVRVNDVPITVDAGTTVAVAMMIAGQACRVSVSGEARGPLCGMGICYECRVTVNGVRHCKGCQILCEAGMEIHTNE
ncbi:MAG: (2Fe-2S)-binding protein [Candidatus Sulfotelmatobacter sp.]